MAQTSVRGVRSLNATHFNAPWPFVKKGAMGQRKIGPYRVEKYKWPGPNREFAELTPKWNKENPASLHGYTGVAPEGYTDENGKFVHVEEMKTTIVAPDLTGFKLKPYVSYRTDVEIEKREKAYEAKVREKGSETLADLYTSEEQRWPPPRMTAETLFELVYGEQVRQAFKAGAYGHVSTIEDKTRPAEGAQIREIK